MKKSNSIAVVLILASIGASCLTLAALTSILLYQESYCPLPEPYSSAFPYIQDVTKSGGYYNISLAFSNVTYSQRLDNILVNPNTSEDKTNPTIYLNGTIANTYPLSCLQKGDSLQVNLTLSCIEYASGSTLCLYVMGDCFGCGKSVVLP